MKESSPSRRRLGRPPPPGLSTTTVSPTRGASTSIPWISTSAAVVLEQVHALAYGLRHPELNPVADELLEVRRAVDHLAPAARVGALREPAAPILYGPHKELLFLKLRDREATTLPRLDLSKREHGRPVLFKGEICRGCITVLLYRNIRGQAQAQLWRVEASTVSGDLGLVLLSGVVESWGALHPEGHNPPGDPDAPDQLAGPFAAVRLGGRRGGHRHVVHDLPDPIRGKEPRDQDVGVRPVELLAAYPVPHGGYLEAPAFLIVEDGGEDARGVEARQTEPVDRAVCSYKGRTTQVSDETVVLYWLVGHGAFSLASPYLLPLCHRRGSGRLHRGDSVSQGDHIHMGAYPKPRIERLLIVELRGAHRLTDRPRQVVQRAESSSEKNSSPASQRRQITS